jgi:hypothetical protein
MQHDAQGLIITTGSDTSTTAFDHVVEGYLKYRADLPQRVKILLETDPEFGLAHCVQGYLSMLAYKESVVPYAIKSERLAREHTARATRRERAHVDALAAWIAGNLDGAIAIWEGILRDHPRDVIAFRLAHFSNFWLGRPADMAASVERILPAWSETDGVTFASILACRCFALEEAGNLLAAEPVGRRAIDIDPTDLWAAHAVAHVLEMQGRRAEGQLWLAALAPGWEGSNNLQHHLWWHAALFRLEQGDTSGVLELYDTRFRNLSSPLTLANPDVYIDIQNAASMLFRLERLGVAVGDRWVELADKAEARIGDCLSAFTLPHWLMALTATGRDETARLMIKGMRDFAKGRGTLAPIVRNFVLPISEALIAHRSGQHAEAVELMRPALGGMHQLGGSRAQQDVLEQLFVDAALKAGLDADVSLAIERVAGRRSVPPARWIGWRSAVERSAAAL